MALSNENISPFASMQENESDEEIFKWWYSASHNVTAMVGAGALGLPYAMAQLGWGPGIAILVLSWVITLYTLWQMVEMHEMVPERRFRGFHELSQYAFGEKLGLYIIVPQKIFVEVAVCIIYMVTGGKSLKKFHDTVCSSSCKDIKLTYFIMIFASVHFVLSHLPKFKSISGVTLAAAAMSLSYSTIAWGASIHKGVQADVQYGYKAETASGKVLDFFSALGDVAFAFAGAHNVVLKIQAKIPSTPAKPSKGLMWRAVVVAYIVVAFCYFPVALIGYWMFGNSVEDDILISLEKPAWLIGMANIFVVIHVIGCYQIYAMPVFDMMETVLVKKLNFSSTKLFRFVVRNIYVGFTMFIAITFPFFRDLLAFFGGLALVPITYFLPCIVWLAIKKPRKYSLSWWTNWFCIIFGLSMMILSAVGGLRQIILSVKTYKFYSLQLSMSIVLLPMSLHTAVELGVFEIIAEAGPGAKLSASEIETQLNTTNSDAAAMLLLCPYTLCLTKMVFHCVATAQRVKVRVLPVSLSVVV